MYQVRSPRLLPVRSYSVSLADGKEFTMGNLQFKPTAFIENLKYMGIGMLGVFMIIGIIIGATYLISYLTNKLARPKDE